MMLEFGIIVASIATIAYLAFYIYDKKHPTPKAH